MGPRDANLQKIGEVWGFTALNVEINSFWDEAPKSNGIQPAARGDICKLRTCIYYENCTVI